MPVSSKRGCQTMVLATRVHPHHGTKASHVRRSMTVNGGIKRAETAKHLNDSHLDGGIRPLTCLDSLQRATSINTVKAVARSWMPFPNNEECAAKVELYSEKYVRRVSKVLFRSSSLS